jgi:hypothetical protein
MLIITFVLLAIGLTIIKGDNLLKDCKCDQEVENTLKKTINDKMITSVKTNSRIARKVDNNVASVNPINVKPHILNSWLGSRLFQDKDGNSIHPRSFDYQSFDTSSDYYPMADEKSLIRSSHPLLIENEIKRNDINLPFFNYGLRDAYTTPWAYTSGARWPSAYEPIRMSTAISPIAVSSPYDMALDSASHFQWYNYLSSPFYSIPIFTGFEKVLTESEFKGLKASLDEDEKQKSSNHKSSSGKSKRGWTFSLPRIPLPSLRSFFKIKSSVASDANDAES